MTHRRSTNDTHVDDLLPAYLNGTLDSEAAIQVRAHLDRCGVCRAELVEWEVVATATRGSVDTLPMPAAQGLDRIQAMLDASSREEVASPHKENDTVQPVLSLPISTPRRPAIAVMPALRWIAAGLVLALAVGIAAYSRLGVPEDPQRLPAAFLASPESDACPASPDESLDRRALEGATQAESIVTPLEGTFEGRPGVPADVLPTGGEPADQATVDGISRTVQELVACVRADDAAGTDALTTDDYWRRMNGAGVSIDQDAAPSVVPLVRPVDGSLPVPAVEDARMLPDGRVGAVIRPGFDAPSWTFDYYVFANVDGRWLIDEAVHVTEFLMVDIVVTDEGFAPAEIIVPPVPATLSVTNEGSQPHSLVVPDLLVRIEVAPRETATANLKAPSGTYAFRSDVPGDARDVFSGTLRIEGDSAATPITTPETAEDAVPAVPGLPVVSATISMQPPEAYVPNQITILAGRDVEITLTNEGPPEVELPEAGVEAGGEFTANFTIDALGVSVDIAEGESQTIVINAPAGVYAFHSTIPGHTEVGMSGTLYVVAPATPAP